MDPFYPHSSACNKVKECIDKYLMSKEETERYLEDQQGITRQDTNMAWILLERMRPDLFTSYYARIHERNARTRERVSSTSPRERSSAILGGQEQQRLSPARRSLLPDLNVPDASPQEANAVYPTSQAGTSIASNANAIGNQNLQTSQQQPVIPNEFWQQVLNALGQIIKLLSDGHGVGPHPSATGSLKRKRVGENEGRGENEEAEKHIMEKKEGNKEEAEKQQKNEEGNDEELQKNEGGDNVCISREAARSESTNATIIAWTVLTYYISIVFYYQRTHTCWYDCLCSHCHSRRTLKNIGEQFFSVYLLGSLEAFVLLRRDINM